MFALCVNRLAILQTWILEKIMGDPSSFLDSANNQTAILVAPAIDKDNNELQAILSPSTEVCLLRDSPFRILRVSEQTTQYCTILKKI